jgi:glycosyltransferase involved in cell wall biosynthesis
LARLPLQYADRYSASGVTHFVANSQFVAARIRRYYGRDARVVYPPVSIKGAVTTVSRHRDRFLLYIGRLVPYKRVHLLVAAANRLGLRLIVAGDGPDRLRLERIADRNTEFLGHVDEATAAELLSRCALFVFAAQEDFGIAPVEANAHGVPVVAFAGGAIAETMVAGVTAELFREPTADSVKDAVLRALSRSWDEETLRANAERFSPLRFRKAFAGVLNAALSGERW